MAKTKKVRQEIKLLKHKKRENAVSYFHGDLNAALKEAKSTVSTYDDLMVNCSRKRVGSSEYQDLLRKLLNSMNRCFENIKLSYSTNRQDGDINTIINTLAELNSRLMNVPKDYKDACVKGRIILMKRDMQQTINSYEEFKTFYVDLCDRKEQSKISTDEFVQKIRGEIGVLIETIDNLLIEKRSLNSLICEHSRTEEEILYQAAQKSGISIGKDEFSKDKLISVLETKLESITNNNKILEYRIVIETIKEMDSQELNYYYLIENLERLILPKLKSMIRELDSHIILEKQNVGVVSSDLSKKSITSLAMPTRIQNTYRVEQEDVNAIADFKERQIQRLLKGGMALCGFILIEAIAVLIKQTDFEPSIIANFISAIGGTTTLYLLYKYIKEFTEEYHKMRDSEQIKTYIIEPKK